MKRCTYFLGIRDKNSNFVLVVVLASSILKASINDGDGNGNGGASDGDINDGDDEINDGNGDSQ